MSENKPRILVLGAGCVGLYVGGRLINLGKERCDVTFVGRERFGGIVNQHGLTVTSFEATDPQPNVAPVLDCKISPEDVHYVVDSKEAVEDGPPADYVIIAVKCKDTISDSIVSCIKSLPTTTKIISLQNGVRNVDLLKGVLPEYPIFAGMIPFAVLHKGEGVIHRGTSGPLCFEEGIGELEKLLIDCGFAVQLYTPEDMKSVQYGKLVVNLNNGINALSGQLLREQILDKQYRHVLALMQQEAIKVLEAAKITPKNPLNNIPLWIVPKVMGLPNWMFLGVANLKLDDVSRSSMYDDLSTNRPTEIDQLNGEIIALGEQHEIDTPITKLVSDLIKQAEIDGNGSPNISSEELLRMTKEKSAPKEHSCSIL